MTEIPLGHLRLGHLLDTHDLDTTLKPMVGKSLGQRYGLNTALTSTHLFGLAPYYFWAPVLEASFCMQSFASVLRELVENARATTSSCVPTASHTICSSLGACCSKARRSASSRHFRARPGAGGARSPAGVFNLKENRDRIRMFTSHVGQHGVFERACT